jgi:hypothetical protein
MTYSVTVVDVSGRMSTQTVEAEHWHIHEEGDEAGRLTFYDDVGRIVREFDVHRWAGFSAPYPLDDADMTDRP